MTEIWKPLKINNQYEVSNLGRVKSFVGKKPKVLKNSLNSNGYPRITLKGRIKKYVHTLVLETFKPLESYENLEVGHLNGNRKDIRLVNLKWVTPLENASHKKIHGTENEGAKNGMSKLTEKDVLEILTFKDKAKISNEKISKMFNVSRRAIDRIINNTAWTNIPRKQAKELAQREL